jgi:hypothetical protein
MRLGFAGVCGEACRAGGGGRGEPMKGCVRATVLLNFTLPVEVPLGFFISLFAAFCAFTLFKFSALLFFLLIPPALLFFSTCKSSSATLVSCLSSTSLSS